MNNTFSFTKELADIFVIWHYQNSDIFTELILNIEEYLDAGECVFTTYENKNGFGDFDISLNAQGEWTLEGTGEDEERYYYYSEGTPTAEEFIKFFNWLQENFILPKGWHIDDWEMNSYT